MMQASVLNNDEKAIFALRSLYSKYGYTQYKMSKFEEYDLYVQNKDFLISDHIITFTDTNGKLMALKPDVTLSIIKNSKDLPGYVQKLYYNENVYRVSKGTRSFKEIMQVGLECIGDIDAYCIYEVLLLAAESLKEISPEAVLDISHLGILSALLTQLSVSREAEEAILKCLSEKSLHELEALCRANQVDPKVIEALKELLTTYGSPEEVLPRLDQLTRFPGVASAVAQLKEILAAFEGSPLKNMLRIDFSVVGNMNYYNGIVFKGFINGIPGSILSGGQYDKLMQKMGRRSGSIGFAVYLDLLERLGTSEEPYDADLVLLYNAETDLKTLAETIRQLTAAGKRVMAERSVPQKLRYRQLATLEEGEVKLLETNA